MFAAAQYSVTPTKRTHSRLPERAQVLDAHEKPVACRRPSPTQVIQSKSTAVTRRGNEVNAQLRFFGFPPESVVGPIKTCLPFPPLGISRGLQNLSPRVTGIIAEYENLRSLLTLSVPARTGMPLS